ncbi:MAG: ATP-binding protein [Acidobacteria bacterium]|nr:ATP-binding protein [Acidobacteriota bacterium]
MLQPLYTLYIKPSDRPLFIVFTLFALLVTWFSAVRGRVESELRQARDKLEIEVAERTQQASLLNLTHDTIFVRDMSDVITYWNRGAQELYGWTAEEVIGKRAHELLQTVFPGPIEEIRAELLRSGRWDGELEKTRADGTRLVVSSRWSLQRDEQERPAAILETNNDITERKRAEDALRHAQTELAHVARVATLGELTASIAHEINQPLGAVVNNASACLRWLTAQNTEEARRSAELVIADGHRAAEIIGRIRNLAKKMPPQKDWLDINDMIREIIALARSEVQGNRVTLQTHFAGDLPLISGDRIQLQQVMLNLIMNAIEAISGAGEGPRQLLVRSGAEEPQSVLVELRDSGPGLDPKSLDRLFDAFYTTKPHGLGMGLAISRSIVEAHGGRLWATAYDGRGATFQFTLPTGGERAS